MRTLRPVARGAIATTFLVAGLASPGAFAGVLVENESGACLEIERVRMGLEQVLSEAPQPELVDPEIRVRAVSGPGGYIVLLQAEGVGGGADLEREYLIPGADCPEAGALLVAVLERHVRGLPGGGALSAAPAEAVETPPGPVAGPDEAPRSVGPSGPPPIYRLSARSALWGHRAPSGGDAEIGIQLGREAGHHELFTEVIARGGWPQRLDGGHYQASALLAGAGWRSRVGIAQVGAGVRAGGLMVSGLDYEVENRITWLPWAEAVASAGVRAGRWSLGPEIAWSPLRYRVVTARRIRAERIPAVRLGFFVHWTFSAGVR